MSNPSFDYKQYVLANLPDDIEYDPKDGFYSHNGHKFPTFLQCKWYKDYILKHTAKLDENKASKFEYPELGDGVE